MVDALRGAAPVLFCGNGGSSMDAGHLAAELTGRFAYDRPGLAAVNLADATAALTAIANDYSYADVFARMATAIGKPGDVLVGLSTSGNSANVVRALAAGREAGLVTVGLTGRDGGQLAAVAEHCIRVPSDDTARVQEACLHVGHTHLRARRAGDVPPGLSPPVLRDGRPAGGVRRPHQGGRSARSTTSSPAARSASSPSPATNSSGSRHAYTTRAMPARRMCWLQVTGRDERSAHGSSDE
jgi:D-sedoheptulose 7-phosphate isomerase